MSYLSWGKAGKRLWPILTTALLLFPNAVYSPQPVAASGVIHAGNIQVKAAGKNFTVQTVSIPKGTPVSIGLAKHQVGSVESFTSIVHQYKAAAAINGAFFSAYQDPPEPYGTLIIHGQLANVGRYGTTIGFKQDGTVIMDTLRPSITGTSKDVTGKSNGWYADFMNRTADTSRSEIDMYTPERGKKVGFQGGVAITIVNHVVTRNGINHNAAIPSNGYVIVLAGARKDYASRFPVGSTVQMNLSYKDMDGKELNWSDVHTAVGAGPRLIRDGQVSLNPKAEGFADPKILTSSAARSGIAIMQDGSVLLATVHGATMGQWAAIMKAMGAKQAMNLDGGASSAMYASGKMLTPAGRLLSNTLIFGSSMK